MLCRFVESKDGGFPVRPSLDSTISQGRETTQLMFTDAGRWLGNPTFGSAVGTLFCLAAKPTPV